MLLTITTTHQPATDLGYLLHKHPERFQSFDLSFGRAFVFYPEASPERCTAALMLDMDPIKLVRKEGATIAQYVNDRPYVASSFLSVAIAQVFSTALAGHCHHKPELPSTPLNLIAKLAVLPCKQGSGFLRRLFEPLGYQITATGHQEDEAFLQWGNSPYFTVQLEGLVTLQQLLEHLYVLIPVLDAQKHYWIGDEEVEKLLRRGESWLGSHPERERIARRYLKQQGYLVRNALTQLTEETMEEEKLEPPLSLNQQRLETVVATLKEAGVRKVLDLGCGEGKLLQKLLQEDSFTKIVGVDVSCRCLEIAKKRLKLDRLPPLQQERIQLLQGSLTYGDKRFKGYDGATVVEVIEHLDPSRLSAFEKVVFALARPKTIVITTPNREYNVKLENLPRNCNGESQSGKLRHPDHRFEWTPSEFQSWAKSVAERFGYEVQFQPIGESDSVVGAPTQMGFFLCQD